MRIAPFLVGLVTVCAGCTSLSLERHTINQVATISDCRFQQVVDNLAATAANPGTLPAYAPMADGLTTLGDTFTFDAKTLWARQMFKGFSTETLGLTGTFNPQPQWTVDPVSVREMLEALHAAMKWVICGPPQPDSDAKTRLDNFQVTRDLQALPPGWLLVGQRKDVPHNALYRAQCKGTWVWVMPAGMEGLSRFTLIVQDIATVDLDSLKTEPPQLALKIKRSVAKSGQDAQDATTVEATVKKDVRPLILPPDKNHPRNWIKEIIASAPGGLGLKEKNERFILASDYILETSQPPNLNPADPGSLPGPAPTERSFTPYQQQPRR